MSTRKDTATTANFLPALAALILLCLGGAAALTLLTHSNTPPAAPAELSLVVQRMPFEAQNALRGEASAFDMPDSSLWTLYERLRADGAPLSMRKVSDRNEIFPVFQDLFHRRTQERAAP